MQMTDFCDHLYDESTDGYIQILKLNDENIHKGYLILINPDNLLKTNEIKLISYSEKYKNIELDQVANSQLQKALKSINANDEIVPISGVRTFEEQKKSIKKLNKNMVVLMLLNM